MQAIVQPKCKPVCTIEPRAFLLHGDPRQPTATSTTHSMTTHSMTTPTELRPIADNVILAGSALLPFTHGSGRDSHGNPVPHGDLVVNDALRLLVQAGQDAQALLDATQSREVTP